MKYLLILILPSLLPAAALARLGENEAQIASRYGDPLKATPSADAIAPLRVYHSRGYQICVSFLDGVSQSEMITKVQPGAFDGPEIDLFLSDNSFGGQWEKLPAPGVATTWKLGDAAVASYRPIPTPILLIGTTRMARFVAQKQADSGRPQPGGDVIVSRAAGGSYQVRQLPKGISARQSVGGGR